MLELGDPSGLNKKSLINETNNFGEVSEEKLDAMKPNLCKLFSLFWKNLEYISNPIKLLNRVKSPNSEEGKFFIF